MQEQKRICIVGGAGFIGSNLYRKLTAEGFLVTTVDMVPFAECPRHQLADVTSLANLTAAPAIYEADIVINCSGFLGVDNVINQFLQTIDVSILGTKNILLSMNESAKIIHFSTSEVYGSSGGYMRESDNINISGPSPDVSPRACYAASKALSEHIVASWGYPYLIIRPFNVTGARQREDFVIPKMVGKALRGEAITATQGCARAFMDVRDFVGCFSSVLRGLLFNKDERHHWHDVINFGNPGNQITMHGLGLKVARIAEEQGYVNGILKIEELQPKPHEILSRSPSVERLTDRCKGVYQLRYNIDDIIKSVFEHALENQGVKELQC